MYSPSKTGFIIVEVPISVPSSLKEIYPAGEGVEMLLVRDIFNTASNVTLSYPTHSSGESIMFWTTTENFPLISYVPSC